MADNTTINTATNPGDVISTEDIGGGIKIPRSKIVLGAHDVDGGNVTATNPLPSNLTQVGSTAIIIGQAAMSASLPVVIASDQSPVGVAGKYSATLPTLSDQQNSIIALDNRSQALVNIGTKLDAATDSFANQNSALYLSGSVATAINASVSLGALTVASPTGSTAIFDAKSLILVVTNPTGATTAITSGNVTFSDTIGGQTVSIIYTLPGTVNITANNNQVFMIPLTNGFLKNLTVNLSYTSTPGAGTINVVTVIRGPSGNTYAPVATSTNGAQPYSYISQASTNQDSQVIRNAPSQIYLLYVFNQTSAIRHLKFYDKASGPTSADTPAFRVPIAANINALGGGAVIPLPVGLVFNNGISFRMTVGLVDSDTGNVAANDVTISLAVK